MTQEQPQKTELELIIERKKFVVTTLTEKYNTDLWRERLLKISGGDESRIMKFMNSFFAYIMSDKGGKDDDSKKKVYIATCAISSISNAFVEAFQMGIEVGGGRDHAYLVNYANICELEVSYKGFVYALAQHYDNPFVVAENVFEGDILVTHTENENASYKHTPNPENAFGNTWGKLKGCFAYFSYTQRDSGEKVARLVRIPKEELEMIKSKARGSFAWKDFPFEQTKKSTLRRLAKIPFAQIDFGDDEVNPEEQDNKHYQLEQSSTDRLKLLIQSRSEDDNENAKTKPDVSMGDAGKQDEGSASGAVSSGEASHATSDSSSGQDNTAHAVNSENVVQKDACGAESQETIEGTCVTIAPDSSGEAHSGESTDAQANPTWDGKTVYMGAGKSISKDNFASATQAAVYLKKVVHQRTKKETRQEIMAGNKLLIIALAKEDMHSVIKELNDLTEEGA